MRKDVFENILQTVGNTPLIRLNNVVPKHFTGTLWAKCEFFNPGGSVKDRIGISIIEEAERRGDIQPGGTIVEATSGNTGMGLALAAAVKGYSCVFVLPDKMSTEKIKTLRAFGARVVVTPAAVSPEDPRSHYSVAKRIAEQTPNSLYANQYHNLDNRKAHVATTGPELWEQTEQKIDAFLAGMGTGGTVTGTGMFLKSKNPKIKIAGVDPVGSILYDFFKTGQIVEPHPYKVEGIGEDMFPENLDFHVLDDIVQVTDKETFAMTRRLLNEEGLFVGPSAGTAVAAAIKYMAQYPQLKNIVVLLPDSGSRYLSKVYDDDWMQEHGFLEQDRQGTAADILDSSGVHEIQFLDASDSIGKAAEFFSKSGLSQAPVLKSKVNGEVSITDIIGLVHERDILSLLIGGKSSTKDPISPMLRGIPPLCRLNASAREVAQLVNEQRAVIVHDQGFVKGLITTIDVVKFFGDAT